MRQFCRSRNRYDPRCFLKQPAKSHLCRGYPPCAPESLQRIYNAGICTHCFRLETRQGLTVVVVYIEDRVFVDAASQKTPVDRAVRDEADTQLPAYIENSVLFYQAVHQMVLALDSRQRTNGVGLAHTPALHFTFLDQVDNSSRYLLGRSIRVGTVLVEHRQ